MRNALTAFLFVFTAATLAACDGSVGNSDSCANVCQWNSDCMLSYFESESICETRCFNDEADGVNQEVWDEVRRCTAKYREYYLCLELQDCIDAIDGLESISGDSGGVDGDADAESKI